MRVFLISVALAAGVGLPAITPAAAQRPSQSQLRARRDSLTARLDTVAQRYQPAMHKDWSRPHIGAIGNAGADTTEDRLPYTRRPLRYVAFALCVGCTDLNIKVFAPDGTKLGEDMGPNATPVVEFNGVTGVYQGHYRVLTTMAGCAQATCEFGLQIMAENLRVGDVVR